MRLLSVILTVFVALSVWYLCDPEPIDRGLATAYRSSNAAILPQTVRIKGLKFVPENELRRLIPEDRSVIWWWFNRDRLQSRVAQHPYIRSVTIEDCDSLISRCFEVTVEERELTHIGYIGDVPWLVGDSQFFIEPLAKKRVIELQSTMEKQTGKYLPVVTGLAPGGSSPEVVSSRLSYITAALAQIQKEIPLKIQVAELTGSGELLLKFRGRRMDVTFDNHFENPDRLSDQITRLREVLERFGPRENQIQSIDLAFNQLAVVKFDTPQVVEPQAGLGVLKSRT